MNVALNPDADENREEIAAYWQRRANKLMGKIVGGSQKMPHEPPPPHEDLVSFWQLERMATADYIEGDAIEAVKDLRYESEVVPKYSKGHVVKAWALAGKGRVIVRFDGHKGTFAVTKECVHKAP